MVSSGVYWTGFTGIDAQELEMERYTRNGFKAISNRT